MPASRKNILFITTDQHRVDHLGCYGNPVIATPHIDALAARGRRFTRNYVASPICMPNRATMMTGRMPSVHGLHCNGVPLALRSNTFGDLLRASGYRTGLVGKSHLQNMTGLPPAAATPQADRALTPPPVALGETEKAMWSDGNYNEESLKRWQSDPQPIPGPYYGFDEIELCTMHGDMVHGDYDGWLKQRLPNADAARGPANALPDDRYTVPQAYRTRVPEELYPTRYIQERTVARLESLAQDDAPFFLHCSFPDPHHPFTPPGHYWDMYDPAKVPLSPIAGHPADHPIITRLRELREAGKAKTLGTVPFVVDVEETRQAIALTYGMITMIDDAVGAIVATLERLGLADTTTVIFTSDHGDFMGDHGLMLKSSLHYDGLVRVPLIWCDPDEKNGGAAIDALTSTIDLAPSFLDTAGLAPFHGMQGRSLRPLLHDPKADWRKAVLIEEDGHEAFPGFDGPLRTRSIVTQRHRMSIYDKLPLVELYDLSTDPWEQTNLADTPGGARIRAGLFEEMSRTMMEMCDWSPFPTGRA